MDEGPSVNRRLAAILAADMAGYSRLMHEDETATVRDLKAHQSVILPLIGTVGGSSTPPAMASWLSFPASYAPPSARSRSRP
jgi:hypothetical protein